MWWERNREFTDLLRLQVERAGRIRELKKRNRDSVVCKAEGKPEKCY